MSGAFEAQNARSRKDKAYATPPLSRVSYIPLLTEAARSWPMLFRANALQNYLRVWRPTRALKCPREGGGRDRRYRTKCRGLFSVRCCDVMLLGRQNDGGHRHTASFGV